VLIQPNGNVADDVTDLIHPDVAYMAALAARVVGLDIAGIDLVCEDISRPLDEQRGAIIEVNSSPGLLAHIKPASGEAAPECRQAIVEHLFAEGETGRIPLVGVTGTLGTSLAASLIGCLLYHAGKHAGVANREGLFLDGRQVTARLHPLRRRPAPADQPQRAGRRVRIERAQPSSPKACPTTAARWAW
jgi:cyanophycin synthetase